MFLDASAIVAIVAREEDRRVFLRAALAAQRRSTSSLALFEAVIGVSRKPGGSYERAALGVAGFCRSMSAEILDITEDVGNLALRAWVQYGKGRGHPAQLNMGDCFAYACARHHNVPLLFKGDDFIHTDIEPALRPGA